MLSAIPDAGTRKRHACLPFLHGRRRAAAFCPTKRAWRRRILQSGVLRNAAADRGFSKLYHPVPELSMLIQ